MGHEHLTTYLNDHLAGSVVALELLGHLEESHPDGDIVRFAAELRADIEADRQQLRTLMDYLHISESSPRKAAAWLTEKFSELKLRLDDKVGGALHLFEALEALSLGIEGKRALWLALHTATINVLDYELLIKRAEEQRSRVETVRLQTAKVALAPSAEANG
jgi:hypothetical protein